MTSPLWKGTFCASRHFRLSDLFINPCWALIISYPSMDAIQEAIALPGRATDRGLASKIARRYPATIGYGISLLLLVAYIVNAAANLGEIAAAIHLLVGGW